MTKLYIDTNIFINAINAETNIYGKDLSNVALQLFYQVISCKYQILLSSWALYELYKKVKPEEAEMIFILCKKKIIKVIHNQEDISRARIRSPDNFDDAVHIILAEKSNADYIVTRNTTDFENIGTKIPIKIPEALI